MPDSDCPLGRADASPLISAKILQPTSSIGGFHPDLPDEPPQAELTDGLRGPRAVASSDSDPVIRGIRRLINLPHMLIKGTTDSTEEKYPFVEISELVRPKRTYTRYLSNMKRNHLRSSPDDLSNRLPARTVLDG